MRQSNDLKALSFFILLIIGLLVLPHLLHQVYSAYQHRPPPPLSEVFREANSVHIGSHVNELSLDISSDENVQQFRQLIQSSGKHIGPRGDIHSPYLCSVILYYGFAGQSAHYAVYNCPEPGRYLYIPQTGEIGRDDEWYYVPEDFRLWILKRLQ